MPTNYSFHWEERLKIQILASVSERKERATFEKNKMLIYTQRFRVMRSLNLVMMQQVA
jgi:hypothetical protein